MSSFDFSESDRILRIYTKGNALVKAIAKGARKAKSKFSGKIEPLSCCDFLFSRGRNLNIVSECSQVNCFKLLRSDLQRLSYGLLFLEIVNSFAREAESESAEIFNLLYFSLEKLEMEPEISLLAVSFVTDFLFLHGYRPQFETCVSCSKYIAVPGSLDTGKPVYEKMQYSTVLGGLLCNNCARLVSHKVIDFQVLEILKAFSQNHSYVAGATTPDKLLSNIKITKQPDKNDIYFALRLLKEHIDARSDREIKSFDLVFSL